MHVLEVLQMRATSLLLENRLCQRGAPELKGQRSYVPERLRRVHFVSYRKGRQAA